LPFLLNSVKKAHFYFYFNGRQIHFDESPFK
jgi:hypothetical protein